MASKTVAQLGEHPHEEVAGSSPAGQFFRVFITPRRMAKIRGVRPSPFGVRRSGGALRGSNADEHFRPPGSAVLLKKFAGIAQLVERQISNLNVVGSNPTARSIYPESGRSAGVARSSGGREVVGSIPTAPTRMRENEHGCLSGSPGRPAEGRSLSDGEALTPTGRGGIRAHGKISRLGSSGVEHRIENPGVGGSMPPPGTTTRLVGQWVKICQLPLASTSLKRSTGALHAYGTGCRACHAGNHGFDPRTLRHISRSPRPWTAPRGPPWCAVEQSGSSLGS